MTLWQPFVSVSVKYEPHPGIEHRLGEQMLVPDLYVFTLKFEIPQKRLKHENKILHNLKKQNFLPLFYATF
jgi:hypothetical protein